MGILFLPKIETKELELFGQRCFRPQYGDSFFTQHQKLGLRRIPLVVFVPSMGILFLPYYCRCC